MNTGESSDKFVVEPDISDKAFRVNEINLNQFACEDYVESILEEKRVYPLSAIEVKIC